MAAATVAVLAGAAVILGAARPAAASLPPGGGGSQCSSVTSTYVGVPGQHGNDGSVQHYDMTGSVCAERTAGNQVYLWMAWNAHGHHVNEAIFYYQLHDCSTGAVVSSDRMEYPYGTAANGDATYRYVGVTPGRTYYAVLYGQGSQIYSGAIDESFGSQAIPDNIIPFQTGTICV